MSRSAPGAQDPVPSVIQADFDRIALLHDDGWNHNNHYHRFLLDQLPAHCGTALDLGCGTGAFSRLLAARCDRTLGLDLSPQMVQVARDRSAQYPNLEFEVADITTWSWPEEQFDCIASTATLHHLEMRSTLTRMKASLRDGGTILILDLYRAAGPADILWSVPAMPVNLGMRLLKTGRLKPRPEVLAAWQEHGRHDTYPTLSQVRRACAAVLTGAQVRRHLLWRYSIVWHKQSQGGSQ